MSTFQFWFRDGSHGAEEIDEESVALKRAQDDPLCVELKRVHAYEYCGHQHGTAETLWTREPGPVALPGAVDEALFRSALDEALFRSALGAARPVTRKMVEEAFWATVPDLSQQLRERDLLETAQATVRETVVPGLMQALREEGCDVEELGE